MKIFRKISDNLSFWAQKKLLSRILMEPGSEGARTYDFYFRGRKQFNQGEQSQEVLEVKMDTVAYWKFRKSPFYKFLSDTPGRDDQRPVDIDKLVKFFAEKDVDIQRRTLYVGADGKGPQVSVSQTYRDGKLAWDVQNSRERGSFPDYWDREDTYSLHRHYDEDGKLSSMCENEKLEGVDYQTNKYFYPDESLRRVTELKDGLDNGVHMSFHPNGELEKEEYYKQDQCHGFSAKYDEQGQLITKYHYKNGVLDGA